MLLIKFCHKLLCIVHLHKHCVGFDLRVVGMSTASCHSKPSQFEMINEEYESGNQREKSCASSVHLLVSEDQRCCHVLIRSTF